MYHTQKSKLPIYEQSSHTTLGINDIAAAWLVVAIVIVALALMA